MLCMILLPQLLIMTQSVIGGPSCKVHCSLTGILYISNNHMGQTSGRVFREAIPVKYIRRRKVWERYDNLHDARRGQILINVYWEKLLVNLRRQLGRNSSWEVGKNVNRKSGRSLGWPCIKIDLPIVDLYHDLSALNLIDILKTSPPYMW